jgi:hypothetical protein
MALKRVWTPTNNYSSGGTKTILVIHSMEGFTGANGAKDCAIYFQGNVGASSQVCIDNNRGTIWEGVARQYGSWTQCNYNSRAISCEQSGYASWSKDYWLTNRSNQLHNVADWLAEESAKTGIPLVKISDPNGTGVIYHSNLGPTGCGHSDPGNGWPINEVLAWAKGGSTPAESEEMDMAASVAYYNGKPYFAYVGPDHKVRVNGGIIDKDNYAKSGADIDIDQTSGQKMVCYTNRDGLLCTYLQNVGDSKWYWENRDMATI